MVVFMEKMLLLVVTVLLTVVLMEVLMVMVAVVVVIVVVYQNLYLARFCHLSAGEPSGCIKMRCKPW